MIMFIGGRGSGKTRRCIEFSVRTGIPILCQNPHYVKVVAKEHGLSIPEPISYSDWLSWRRYVEPEVKGRSLPRLRNNSVIIDELGLFLNALGVSPEYVTIDETGNYITRDEDKGAS